MRLVNVLFNYKKSKNQNKTLGVERCFVDYSKNLTATGHQLLTITKPKMVFSDEIKKTRSRFAEISAINNLDIFSAIRMAILFLSFKPDAIICHSGRAVVLSRIARFLLCKKIPIIAIDHGSNPKKFLRADYVLTVNSFFNSELIKAGKSPDQTFVISNMVEIPQNFKPLIKQPFCKPIRIGSLGRIYSGKNFDKVLQAMAILRERGIESEYFLGGVGPGEKHLKDLARNLKLNKNFRILGWVNDKAAFFDSIDIFILPSKHETFGIVLLEAMLYSTPIITSNSWGPDEVIDNEINGLKVDRSNDEEMPELLANAIERLVKDENFAKSLATKASEKFFTNYSSEKVIQKLNEIISFIVKKSQNQ